MGLRAGTALSLGPPSGPPSGPYAAECVEGEFREVRLRRRVRRDLLPAVTVGRHGPPLGNPQS